MRAAHTATSLTKSKQRFLKKARKNFWELRALGPGVPIIATTGGD